MKNLIALGLSVLLLLAACSRSSVLKIVEQGSFAVGGTVLTDSLGRTYHGDMHTCFIRSRLMHKNIHSFLLTE